MLPFRYEIQESRCEDRMRELAQDHRGGAAATRPRRSPRRGVLRLLTAGPLRANDGVDATMRATTQRIA